jgi:hypothetical protein
LWTVEIWIILRGCAFVFFELTGGQGGTFFFFFGPFCSRSTTPISYDITTRTGPEGRSRRPTDNDMARSEEKDEKLKGKKIASQAGMSCSPGAGSGQTGQDALVWNCLCSGQSKREGVHGVEGGINHKKPDKKMRSDRKEKK